MSPNSRKTIINGQTVETTPVFESYWRFAAERQAIFFKRLYGANEPHLTSDPVLQTFKFTNAYRASDRVSQFLIKQVIYDRAENQDPANQFFRVMLFKIFNKVETWTRLERAFGQVSLSSYDYDSFDEVLTQAMEGGERVYSAAYIMPSAGSALGGRYKHQSHLRLIEYMLAEQFPERLARARSMADAFEIMLSAPSIGPFLAYQYITDINYGSLTNFSEMEFVKAGPGALDGISKCFVDGDQLDPTAVITYMAENQEIWFDFFEIDFQSLFGRPLQLIDCQNLFCEISKYARAAHPEIEGVAGRTRIKQRYVPKGRPPGPWYPPKWGLNERIELASRSHGQEQVRGGSQCPSSGQYTLL